MNALDIRILSLLKAKPHTFKELLELTWGIAPSDLDKNLNKLQAEQYIIKRGEFFEHVHATQQSSTHTVSPDLPKKAAFTKAEKEINKFFSKLPIPHPHDFDWRFTAKGVRAFVEHILRYHKKEDSICVIAAPTVYVYLRFLDYFHSISLIERSMDTVDSIRQLIGDSYGVCSHDLQYPWTRFIGEFNCIIMDPPWYQDYYELFFLRAIEILSAGGFIHTAIFPPFAKGHALLERSSIISFSQNRGLHLLELKSSLLEYESPAFEKQSFSVERFDLVSNWRNGDVATFFLGPKYERDHVFQVETGRWREFRIGRSKLKLRMDESVEGYEAPTIEPVEENKSPFLSSISRKYPPRDQIGLWTSCQQAFKIKGAKVIDILLDSILHEKSIENAIDGVADRFSLPVDTVKRDCTECFKKLKEIVNKEKEVQNGTGREV